MFGISHPQILYPHLTFVLTGIFSKYSFSEDLHRICIELGTSILIVYMYSTLIMFTYRYAQTLETTTPQRILESPKFYILHILVLILICLANIGPMQSVFLSDSELKPLYEIEFPEIYDKYQNRIFIGIKEIPSFIYYSMTFFIVLTVIITLYCTFMTYRNLRRIKYRLSPKTFHLYRRLTNALFREFCLFSLFGGVPALFFMISVKFNTSHSIIIGQFVIFLVRFLPPSVIILNLVYIEAYKRALTNLMNQILIFAKLKKKRAIAVASIVVALKVEMMPRWKSKRSAMP
uniref:G protein-coupled receptor n=1 Tax=Acrobeloides nanus TaxID=290746 RepID=A0A914ECQ2_9BILA